MVKSVRKRSKSVKVKKNKANSWVKFLKKNGGHGHTLKGLKRLYRSGKSSPRKSPKKSPVKRSKKSSEVKRCSSRKKRVCGSDPQCEWTKNRKRPCRLRKGSHQGEVYQGPHNKPE